MPFQTKIVVQMRGHMLLYGVNERPLPLLLDNAHARRLGCHAEVSLVPVFIECHTSLRRQIESCPLKASPL